ncbi:sensor domain-containing diguanylate cyclase [Fredinandcohnia sp. QZ13]|uniref:sensor domain-containing diguanylate cyclase n=1 Tax=Fredinandcohnia sp. QZ13 TaxID=3073144 RepID=UPI0028530BA3|nr:sensor domain-containing diguanylate cyclase [Fredinandcohnia sp. QZ13]MDR4888140.1 sensor domain-containing diguanylate cyclase [Fredinandcohnia sp. QZ13]
MKKTIQNLNVLRKLSELIDKVGSEKNLISDETRSFFDEIGQEQEEQEITNTLLTQLQQMNEQMENMHWMNKHYRILHEFAQICSKTLNESVLLQKSYEMVSRVMPTDSFYIALHNPGDAHIQMIFIMDNGEPAPPSTVEFGENYTSKVIKTREIVHLKHRNQNIEYDTKMGEGEQDTRSCLFVPVVMDDQVKGVISAQSYRDFAYRKEHEDLLQMIGAQVINSIETARLYGKIYTMSRTDELTGLKNHRAFHEDLAQLIRNDDGEITVMMIDSDDLKKVNDRFGHDAGDLYLKILADGIKTLCDDNMEGYRYAGDEFMILIKTHIDLGVKDIYFKLKEYYTEHPLIVDDEKITVSISTGVGVYPYNGTTVDALKKAADQALYAAKESGKNRIVLAN